MIIILYVKEWTVLKNCGNEKSDLNNLEDINIRFILSYFKNTIPGNLFAAPTESDINNYKLIYQNIRKMFLDK